MKPDSPIDTVVFDVGNVLVEWNPRFLYRSVFDDDAEMEHFLAHVCTMEWHVAHDAGVSFEENAARLKQQHPDWADLIDQWGARYIEMSPAAVAGVPEILEELKAMGMAVHGLSNMPHGMWPQLRARYPFLGLLQHIVISAEEGVIKPQPEIFEILIARTGAARERTLFIDDALWNVEAARGVGLHAHHFQHADGLRAELAGAGLISTR